MSLAMATDRGAAHELHAWFDRVLDLVDGSLFGVAPEGPHRDAAVLDILTSSARRFTETDLDREGALYGPLTLVLAGACRRLGVRLGEGHWEGAVANVVEVARKLALAGDESAALGLDIGSPAAVFKRHVNEALLHAGVAGTPSFLDVESQRLALALAVTWGIRFLCAYALQFVGPFDPSRRDLAWVREVLRPLLPSSAATA